MCKAYSAKKLAERGLERLTSQKQRQLKDEKLKYLNPELSSLKASPEILVY